MKALVTGAAGFIGSHVVRVLIDRRIDVRAMILPREKTNNLDGLDVEKIEGNILDRSFLDRAVKGCDQVFHLAAIYALWLPEPEVMRRVNVEGTRNVLAAAAEAGVAKVVHTSSISVFGGGASGKPATEDSEFALRHTGNLYALTKYEAQKVAEEFAGKGLDVSIAAPCYPLGPQDIGPTPTGRLLLSAVNLPVAIADGSVNNMVDVRDVAEGHVLAAEKGRPGQTYLLGNKNLSNADLARVAHEIAGIRKPLICLPFAGMVAGGAVMKWWSMYVSKKPPLMTPDAARVSKANLTADCSKAYSELGFPGRPIEESIRDALTWFAKNGYIRNRKAVRNLVVS